jgi:hypothetical protein
MTPVLFACAHAHFLGTNSLPATTQFLRDTYEVTGPIMSQIQLFIANVEAKRRRGD